MVIHQCGHLGALGTYVLTAAENGFAAFLCQTTTPFTAMAGWKKRGIGNNPLAFASPIKGRPPLVFDMASSIVARGNLRQAIREDTSIPNGWAIDMEGNPTTDPQAAWEGAILPVGGYKGMGLAMLVQMLAGSLAATESSPDAAKTSAKGAFIFVVNPSLLSKAYADDMDLWVTNYLEAAGDGNGRYPGMNASSTEKRRKNSGIPVPTGMLREFEKIGLKTGVPFNLIPTNTNSI